MAEMEPGLSWTLGTATPALTAPPFICPVCTRMVWACATVGWMPMQ